MVTLFVAALKLVIVLPEPSFAVIVFVPVNATPFVCGLASVSVNDAKAPGLTVKAALVPILPEAVAVIVNEPVL